MEDVCRRSGIRKEFGLEEKDSRKGSMAMGNRRIRCTVQATLLYDA